MENLFTNISYTHSIYQAGLCHYLIIALILFLSGIFIVISTRNLIKLLIGAEFMLNAVCINFAAINAFICSSNTQGQIFSLIICAIGAINTAVGLTLICAIFFKLKNIDTKNLEQLNEERSI